MLGNSWFKKEKPLLGLTGLGGGVGSNLVGGGSKSATIIDYLVIAGGGGGNGGWSGGGGAGGITHVTDYTLNGGAYEILIGAGGHTTGSDSYLADDTSNFAQMAGGGRGGAYGANNATAGGSGGGGGMSNTGSAFPGAVSSNSLYGGPGHDGHSTTNWQGGGGGALGNTASTQKNGADGPAYSITGASTNYAGGGGAGAYDTSGGSGGAGGGGSATGSQSDTGTNGTANTGGGSGGASSLSGGSGLVIIAYSDEFQEIASIDNTLTYTLDTSGRTGYLVYKFTAGSGYITF